MHHGYIAGHQVARRDHCFIEQHHSLHALAPAADPAARG
jgi:hypothetical protein